MFLSSLGAYIYGYFLLFDIFQIFYSEYVLLL